jgi:hypothetical protein
VIEDRFMLPRDKANHAVYGAGFMLLALAVLPPPWALLVGVVVGATKEVIWDWLMKRGDPGWLDFLATSGGATAIYLGTLAR